MIELLDTKPDLNVQETEYKRLLGYPNSHELEGRARDLADWARHWYSENGKPWVYARRTDQLEISDGKLCMNGLEFSSQRLHRQLEDARAHSAMLVAVSAGRECEEEARRLWQEGKPDEYFFLEIYGSAVVEHLITTTGARFCDWAEPRGLAILPHYSPGYAGWSVSDQSRLLELIGRGEGGDFPQEIQVLETGMLKPKKSMLAVFGITAHVDRVRSLAELIPCERCALQSCRYRRAPYKHSHSPIEDVRRLQARGASGSNGISPESVLRRNARYSVGVRALRKWSQERLQWKILEDDSIDARFRYEGTTCSNLGQQLEFDYCVKLSPATEGYRIGGLRCIPSPGNTGYTKMCEYLKNADALMRAIGDEKPLLGRPLDEVLSWNRQYRPAGCYCDPESREHKWGLVLEVIHFALAQHENGAAKNEKMRTELWSRNDDETL